MQGLQTIATEEGSDLKSIFSEIHPNLKFLAVIGCKSHPVLDSILNSNEFKRDHVGLAWVAFGDQIDAKKGLKAAIRVSTHFLNQPEVIQGYSSPSPLRIGLPITITRDLSRSGKGAFPALRIENQGKVLGVFPSEVEGGGLQTLETWIPILSENIEPSQLKLVASSGFHASTSNRKFDLGELKISAAWTESGWRAFSDRNGILFGVSTNIYLYQGSSGIIDNAMEYEAFNCSPMPARENASK
jgi:hypothetical protein